MKKYKIAIASALMAIAFSSLAFAGTWQKDSYGWWYDNGDGTWAANEWRWIDGNGDGTAESYCFDRNGYLYVNTVTPDGYYVDGNGAWMSEGVVQTQNVLPASYHSYDVPEVPFTSGFSGGYNLEGWQDSYTDGTAFGYLNVEPGGTGNMCIENSVISFSWSRLSDEEIVMYSNGTEFHGFYYPELAQMRVPVGDALYYFNKV